MATRKETAVMDSMGSSQGSSMAVEALQNFIGDSGIKIQADVNLNKLWELIISTKGEDLRHNGWIVNCSMKIVQFYVYNSDDWVRLIPAQKVDAQPGETIEVHGGVFQKKNENMVVYEDNRGTAFNVKKGYLHFWTGSAMIVQGSSIEHFKNQYHNLILF